MCLIPPYFSLLVRAEALYQLVFIEGARYRREEDQSSRKVPGKTPHADYKDALLTLLRLRPDCPPLHSPSSLSSSSGPAPVGRDHAKEILSSAKLPRSRQGRGAQSSSEITPTAEHAEESVIFTAYR